jgi:hypothetical protein
MINLKSTYVYDGTEVKLTGRQANKKIGTNRTHVLHEITPLSEDFDWKKWVPEEQLYEIQDEIK